MNQRSGWRWRIRVAGGEDGRFFPAWSDFGCCFPWYLWRASSSLQASNLSVFLLFFWAEAVGTICSFYLNMFCIFYMNGKGRPCSGLFSPQKPPKLAGGGRRICAPEEQHGVRRMYSPRGGPSRTSCVFWGSIINYACSNARYSSCDTSCLLYTSPSPRDCS